MWKWRNMCGVRRYDNLSMLLWIHWKYLSRKWVRKSFLSYSRGMNLLLLTPLRPNYSFQWQWYFYEYKTLLFYRIYHYVHNSDYWFEGTIEFKGMSRDSSYAFQPRQIIQSLRDSKRVRCLAINEWGWVSYEELWTSRRVLSVEAVGRGG